MSNSTQFEKRGTYTMIYTKITPGYIRKQIENNAIEII